MSSSSSSSGSGSGPTAWEVGRDGGYNRTMDRSVLQKYIVVLSVKRQIRLRNWMSEKEGRARSGHALIKPWNFYQH